MANVPQYSMITTDPSVAVDIKLSAKKDFASEKPTTVSRLFQTAVAKFPDHPALRYKTDTFWEELTYSQYYSKCLEVARAYIEIGLQPLHSVVIAGSNAPEWLFSALGALLAGGILAGIFPDACTEETLKFMKLNFQADVLITDHGTLQALLKVSGFKLSDFKAVVLYGAHEIETSCDNVYVWESFIKCGEGIKLDVVEERIAAQLPGHCAYFCFTSGTTGGPKCIMTSHDNMTWRIKSFCTTVGFSSHSGSDHCLLYRYMDAIAVHEFEVCIPWCLGATVHLAEHDAFKNGKLIETLREVRPTYFFGPPRVWERFMEEVKGIDFRNVQSHLGMDRCYLSICACAPISKAILHYFGKCGINIMELYGMTECGISVTNDKKNYRFGSVGRPIAGSQVKISSGEADHTTGEIMIKGRNVMMGYLADEVKTAQVIDEDGWLHTGDIGELDKDGYLIVRGRKSELIAIGTGLKIHPIPIENEIKKEIPLVRNVVVIGEGRKCLSCLMTLKSPISAIFESQGTLSFDAGIIPDSSTIQSVSELMNIQQGIDRINEGKSPPFKVQKFGLLNKDFTVSGGELGPTLKLRRHFIAEKYSELIAALYDCQGGDDLSEAHI